MVRLFHQNGVPVGTHAVGDRAMDWVVDTYALVEQEQPHSGLRHSIIHANLPTPHALDVMAEPAKEIRRWISGDAARIPLVDRRHLRRQLWSQARPAAGAFEDPAIPRHLWSGGSDYFVTPVAARFGLWASMVRQTAKGTYGPQPFGTAEGVDIHTALRSYTAWGSRQMFLEDKIGTLEVGKRADIAVWDRDLYSVSNEQIKDLKCLMTLLDGEVIYTSPDSSITTEVR